MIWTLVFMVHLGACDVPISADTYRSKKECEAAGRQLYKSLDDDKKLDWACIDSWITVDEKYRGAEAINGHLQEKK